MQMSLFNRIIFDRNAVDCLEIHVAPRKMPDAFGAMLANNFRARSLGISSAHLNGQLTSGIDQGNNVALIPSKW